MVNFASSQQCQTKLRLYFGVCVLQKFQQSGHRDGRFACGRYSLRTGSFLFTFLSEKELSICYGIVFFLWEEMPLIHVCTEMGGLLEFCGHVIVPVLFFAVGFFQGKPLWGVFTAVLWLLSLLWFICVCRHSVARTFHRKGYKAISPSLQIRST